MRTFVAIALAVVSLVSHAQDRVIQKATQDQITEGLNDSRFVTPFGLAFRLSTLNLLNALTNGDTRPVILNNGLTVNGSTIDVPFGINSTGTITAGIFSGGGQSLFNVPPAAFLSTNSPALGKTYVAISGLSGYWATVGGGDMLAANNLSDVANAATARANLGANNADNLTAGTVTLARGGTGASLSDPGADRIPFWDDSAGVVNWLAPGAGLVISGTTITAPGGTTNVVTEETVTYLTAPDGRHIIYGYSAGLGPGHTAVLFDDGTTKALEASAGSGDLSLRGHGADPATVTVRSNGNLNVTGSRLNGSIVDFVYIDANENLVRRRTYESEVANSQLGIKLDDDTNYFLVAASKDFVGSGSYTNAGDFSLRNGRLGAVTYALKAPFSTNYTVTLDDNILACTGTNQVITLPNATNGVPAGKVFTFLMSSTTGYGSAIITNANGVQTVLTAAGLSQTITNGQSLTLISDGANWR